MQHKTLAMLDPTKHSHLKVNTKHFNCTQNQVNITSVIVNELSTVIHEYPIFITKNNTSGEFQLSAVLGFSSGENLYLKGESWQANYLPLDILRRPFQLVAPEENSKSGGHIAIDTASPQLQEQTGELLFDNTGKPTAYLERIQKTFSQLLNGAQQTKNILKKAEEFGLIEPITLNIELNDKEATTLNGLYSFNQKAITALTGDALQACHENSVLQVCHLVLSSGIHLEKLIKWKNQLS